MRSGQFGKRLSNMYAGPGLILALRAEEEKAMGTDHLSSFGVTSTTDVVQGFLGRHANVQARNGRSRGSSVDVALSLANLERSRRQISVHSLEAKTLGSFIHGRRRLSPSKRLQDPSTHELFLIQ